MRVMDLIAALSKVDPELFVTMSNGTGLLPVSAIETATLALDRTQGKHVWFGERDSKYGAVSVSDIENGYDEAGRVLVLSI